MCLWASDDVPLAREGYFPIPKKLNDAAYRPINLGYFLVTSAYPSVGYD